VRHDPPRQRISLQHPETLQVQERHVQIAQAQQQKTYLDGMLARQMAEMKSTNVEGGIGAPVDLEKKRNELQAQLLDLQTKYTADHPDVIKTKSLLAQLDKKIASATAAGNDASTSTTKDLASEPREITQTRLAIRQNEEIIKAKTQQQDQIQKEIRVFQGRVSASPLVEEQFKVLTRDYQSAQVFYEDLLKKQRESEMATDLERKQQGEQFRVLDPPSLPEKPTFPNRLNFALGGLAGGLCLGGGLVFLLELKDQSFRTEPDVIAMLKLPVLVSIPRIESADVEHNMKKVTTSA